MARGSIVKRKSGNYAIVYRVNGKQKWKTIGPNKKETEKALVEALRASYEKKHDEEPKKIAFDEFATKWLRDFAQPRIKPSTFTFYEGIVRVHLIPYFEKTELNRIAIDAVEGYIAVKIREGKLSKRTIGYHLVVLR